MPFCNNCGADVEEDQKFCPECGARLKTEAVSPPPPPQAEIINTENRATDNFILVFITSLRSLLLVRENTLASDGSHSGHNVDHRKPG